MKSRVLEVTQVVQTRLPGCSFVLAFFLGNALQVEHIAYPPTPAAIF